MKRGGFMGKFFSEEALIKYRVRVEIEYFISLCELPLPQLSNFNSSFFEFSEIFKTMNKNPLRK